MSYEPTVVIDGLENGVRVDSRIIEGRVQQAVVEGHRNIEIIAYGQHGLGGRIWKAGGEPVELHIKGSSGQRVGSMGFPGTRIEVEGPASDDLGWLNAGCSIVVKSCDERRRQRDGPGKDLRRRRYRRARNDDDETQPPL